jgi:hypothetical protein
MLENSKNKILGDVLCGVVIRKYNINFNILCKMTSFFDKMAFLVAYNFQ